ncbi:hypothetical protein BDQ17DRAFT_147636 [Cyathus striatus]|nr:hypothetical protein BDQ17DRAFT_147636 [Cyathus striatus]
MPVSRWWDCWDCRYGYGRFRCILLLVDAGWGEYVMLFAFVRRPVPILAIDPVALLVGVGVGDADTDGEEGMTQSSGLISSGLCVRGTLKSSIHKRIDDEYEGERERELKAGGGQNVEVPMLSKWDKGSVVATTSSSWSRDAEINDYMLSDSAAF